MGGLCGVLYSEKLSYLWLARNEWMDPFGVTGLGYLWLARNGGMDPHRVWGLRLRVGNGVWALG